MQPHERLLVWQRCHELVLAVYSATDSWPASERFGVVSQIRRAVVSAASNVVEGNTGRGPKELGRFLLVSAGSLAEVGYLLRLAKDLGYLTEPEVDRLQALPAWLTWCFIRATRRAART